MIHNNTEKQTYPDPEKLFPLVSFLSSIVQLQRKKYFQTVNYDIVKRLETRTEETGNDKLR